jgi:hypothetical protein
MERMDARGRRVRFLSALDKVAASDPAPEDRV